MSPLNDIESTNILLEIRDRLTVLEAQSKLTNQELFGNGQPGILDKHSKKIESLEKNWYRVSGATLVLSAVWSFILERLFHPKP